MDIKAQVNEPIGESDEEMTTEAIDFVVTPETFVAETEDEVEDSVTPSPAEHVAAVALENEAYGEDFFGDTVSEEVVMEVLEVQSVVESLTFEQAQANFKLIGKAPNVTKSQTSYLKPTKKPVGRPRVGVRKEVTSITLSVALKKKAKKNAKKYKMSLSAFVEMLIESQLIADGVKL